MPNVISTMPSTTRIDIPSGVWAANGSPDFFDRALFQDFIAELRTQNVLRRNEDGLLEFDDDITRIGEDARLVLGEEIRHSILSLTFSEFAETVED